MDCFACFDGGSKRQRKEEERLASEEARTKAAEAAQKRSYMRMSIDGELISTDPEIERNFHRMQREALAAQQKDQKQQVPMVDHQINPIINPVPPANAETEDEGNMLVGDFMIPQIIQSQSSIVYPPFGQPNFQLKTNVIHLFQNGHQFYGRAKENPYTHVSRFLEMCQHFKYQGISDDAIRLRLFPHTLGDKAIEWLDSQPIASITTWNDLAKKFCIKFFPPAKIAKLKHDISIFRQGESESFDEAWNRFKNMLRKCPHHGISKGLQVQYFYVGLLPSFKSMVDSSSNGSLTTRTIDDALKLFETVATTSAMWASERTVQKKASGVYEVDTYSALAQLAAKIDSLFHTVESLSQTVNVANVKKSSCEECGADHNTTNCQILTQGVEHVDFAQWGRCQQNHQNSLWGGNQNQFQNQTRHQEHFQQERNSQLEEMFVRFMERTDKYMEANNQFMLNI